MFDCFFDLAMPLSVRTKTKYAFDTHLHAIDFHSYLDVQRCFGKADRVSDLMSTRFDEANSWLRSLYDADHGFWV